MTGILCDAIPIGMCINRVKNRHLGPGLIVIGNFLFFVVESDGTKTEFKAWLSD